MKKKNKLPAVSTLRKKADALLTPIIRGRYPRCLLQAPKCTGATQVAHHHVHKSKSTRLRYELDNLIPLCHHCHAVLHHNESYWASKIVEMKGIAWFKRIDAIKNEIVKADRRFYQGHIERLSPLVPDQIHYNTRSA